MVWLVLSYYHCNQSGICKRFEITASEDSVLLELVELLTTPPSFSSTPPHPRASHPPFLRTHVLLSRTYIHIHNEAHTLSTQTHKTVHTQTHSHSPSHVCLSSSLSFLPTNLSSSYSSSSSPPLNPKSPACPSGTGSWVHGKSSKQIFFFHSVKKIIIITIIK